VHQDAELLSTDCVAADYEQDGNRIPQVSVSASKDSEGRIHISLCNLSHESGADVQIDLRGLAGEKTTVTGTELSSQATNAHNTFQQPDAVSPSEFKAFSLEGSSIRAQLSPMSVTVLEVIAQ
jgi:alpha-N-arabinofuranosidase